MKNDGNRITRPVNRGFNPGLITILIIFSWDIPFSVRKKKFIPSYSLHLQKGSIVLIKKLVSKISLEFHVLDYVDYEN